MTFAYDEQLLSAVEQAMSEPSPYSLLTPGTPEQLFEQRIAKDVSEMIELCILAGDPEQKPLVRQQYLGIAQILLRARLILSSLDGEDIDAIKRLIVAIETRQRPGLRMISNG